MAFKTSTNTKKEKTQSTVDFAAMQKEIISIVGSKKRSLPGVISGIIDLGIQKRPDSEEEFKGNEEDERMEVAADDRVYFKDKTVKGKKIRLKCRPQRDAQQVAVVVDFPQIVVDKAKYFGAESNPSPLRLILNGETSLWMTTRKEEDKRVRVLQKGFSLTETKHPNGKWGFDKKNTLFKLADAAGLVDDEGIFKPEQIDSLVGKIAQFEIRVYMKEVDDKSYYTEEIKLAGTVPEGLPLPEVDDDLLHMIQFDVENKPEDLKQLRQSVVNTMQRALNFEDSVVAEQLKERLSKMAVDQVSKQEAATTKPSEKKEAVSKHDDVVDSDFDQDLPF